MKPFRRWIPEFYPMALILLYCIPDHPNLLIYLLIPALCLLLFNWPWLRISFGVLLSITTIVFFLALVSEIKEYADLIMAWELTIGGSIFLFTNGCASWHFMVKPRPSIKTETIATH